MERLGEMYRNGLGVAENRQKALEWYEKAIHAGNENAEILFWIGWIYDQKSEFSKAVHWYRQAADAGHISAMNNLAYAYQNGEGAPKDSQTAIKFYTNAAVNGNVTAMKNLAIMYKNGEGCTKDLSTAKRWYQQAADAGDDEAKEILSKWSSSSSDCFITTAVCKSFSKPDDCYELTAFRNFRDGWLQQQVDGPNLIAQYYQTAPSIVEHINLLPNAKEIYCGIWDKYLQPCLDCLEKAQYQRCKQIYIKMVESLEKMYG